MAIGGLPALAEQPGGLDSRLSDWRFCSRHVQAAWLRNKGKFINEQFPHQDTRESEVQWNLTVQEFQDDFHGLVCMYFGSETG
jgi:hypothetical protein